MNNKPQKYVHRDSGEVYTLSMGKKMGPDNCLVDVWEFRNSQHYFECNTETEVQKFFVKI